MKLYKLHETDSISWVESENFSGYTFTFNGETFYNFWADCPEKLTTEQWETFKKEFPTLAELKE